MRLSLPCYVVIWLALAAQALSASPANTLAIPDDGWHLWPDTKAVWKDDALYLPDEVDLRALPVNPPTGGWDSLNDTNGVVITLPSTVEQHFWGKFDLRPYKDNYTYASNDPEVRNGNYEGVSWWWRDFPIPDSFRGKLVLLHIRGMRQRAEVYVNQQLVGYDMIAETAFDCDISKAMRPGANNQIAIRITNPGGWMDWQDTHLLKWGKYSFQESHGFGGLDRGLTVTAHGPVYLADTWVLNTAEAHAITAHATVRNTTDQPRIGTLVFNVVDPRTGNVVVSSNVPVALPAHSTQDFQSSITAGQAELWDLNTPRLYNLQTQWNGSQSTDEASSRFGFRSFEPRGIGAQAGLYLNGRRVRLYTAISWGYWGLNALWPTPEFAEKEVRDAKRLNMNMLNFHRDIGKEEVLAKQDELGLLRYMEPGGGATTIDPVTPKATPATPAHVTDTSGSGGDAQSFAQKYEEIKIMRMIHQFRGHPSLVIYVAQNEINPDLSDPRVFNLLRKMHAADPSRIVAIKSGIRPANQAWFAPYHNDPMYDDGTGYSGWRDEHTVGGPGVWRDEMYQRPGKFTHQIDDRKEIVDWGEMLGAAVADNHPLMIRQILAHGGESYDLKDHEEIAAAYHQFLDKWGFRTAFSTDEAFFSDLGNKCYEFWGKVIETARLSESNDILSISGWESTAIENHSGLVDNLRNFKGDPDLIAKKLAPLLPVVKPRGLIYRLGDTSTADIYLLNETGEAAVGKLRLTLTAPDGQTTDLGAFDAPVYVKDQFVYPVKIGLTTPPLGLEGKYKLGLTFDGATPAGNSETLLVVRTDRTDLPAARIGLLGGDITALQKTLAAFPQLQVATYSADGNYDLVIFQPRPGGEIHRTDNGSPIQNTEDAPLYRASIRGKANTFHFTFSDLPPGKAKVSLYFCEPEARRKGERVFDVQINGQIVAPDLDIFAEAGGQNIALAKTYTVNAPNGGIDITCSKAVHGEALFNAIKIEAGDKIIATACGGEPYKDRSGLLWQPHTFGTSLSPSLISKVQAGMPLLVLAGEESAGDPAARELAAAGAFQYSGPVPTSRASWMGNWVFVRRHSLYDGLPVDEVMKGDYQVPVSACYGLQVGGPAVEIIAGYSRDHDRHIGATTFTARLSQGKIVFQGLLGMHPVMQERWMSNALVYLLRKDKP